MKNLILTVALIFGQNLLASQTVLISDVDDTIKISHIPRLGGIKGANMSKDFSGFSKLYGAYQCNNEINQERKKFCTDSMGAVHTGNRWTIYVSGTPSRVGPVNIGAVARTFIFNTKFPNGVVYTRNSISVGTEEFKTKQISKIIDGIKDDNPTIILVGDNGQHDPAVYKNISDKYSSQGVTVYSFIHQLYSTDQDAKEMGAKLKEGQIAFLTASDLALNFYQLGLIEQDDLIKINAKVLSDLLSKRKRIRRKVLPKWVKCKEFIEKYKMPDVYLDKTTQSILNLINSKIKTRCLSKK